ncbi:TRAP transporter substrate-binding protein DctP [Temperatibacter marinus]|uniref:TRAP transporter substrate-binding protein DctP n=1 Tax=Temperatibacter marinus TaxID=1456591 RepID=A0AA52HAD2_9PROT|nr:TRAP transporter substrate-binding protein DctP [Temperatibacter marinus]WND03502.1 TRAP transporter substrate-binding protein DctP [Temperatibacter marinus]
MHHPMPLLKILGFIGLLLNGSQSLVADETDKRPLKMTVGAFAAAGTPWDKDWQTFKKNTEARSKGSAHVKLLVRGETGGEPITMSNIRRNRIQFGGFTLAGGAAVVPELSVLLAPFFFESTEELDWIMDTHMLDVFRPLFAKKNLYLVRWVDVGWLNMYGRKPIVRPEDAAGYRMRSQASKASQIFMTSIGGDMLQMSFQDLIPALQTGLVEGGETGIVLYGVTGLGKEAPHLTLTQHAYDSGIVVANYQWFMSLPKETRELIETSFPSSDAARQGVRGMVRYLENKIAGNKAVTTHRLSKKDRRLWQEATQDNYTKIIKAVGGQSQMIYDAMLKAKKAYEQHQLSKGSS